MTNGVSSENYVFDAVGNRTASHRARGYAYEPYNRMVSAFKTLMTNDANGNLITKTVSGSLTPWTYVWDHENRMKSATLGANSVAYAYDALGRRVRRTQGTQITKFTYDGLDVVMDDVNGALTKYQNGPGIDNKLKLVTGTTSKYFVSDQLGSTNALTSSTGTILEQTSYDSFGNASNANFSSRYQFTGREFDSFTGLHFYRARWYDANIGRFISEDPIGLRGGINKYAYVRNSPTDQRDPLGLYGTSDCSYYQRRCRESGGGYYCQVAESWCNYFPKYDDPDPTRDDDYEGWSRCTRKCLQDCDQEQYCGEPEHPNPDESTDSFFDWKPTTCHVKCYTYCGWEDWGSWGILLWGKPWN